MTYKDISFCSAKNCRNLDCIRNTSSPDFQPGDMPVCYAGFNVNCKEYKKENEVNKKTCRLKEEMPAGHGE